MAAEAPADTASAGEGETRHHTNTRRRVPAPLFNTTTTHFSLACRDGNLLRRLIPIPGSVPAHIRSHPHPHALLPLRHHAHAIPTRIHRIKARHVAEEGGVDGCQGEVDHGLGEREKEADVGVGGLETREDGWLSLSPASCSSPEPSSSCSCSASRASRKRGPVGGAVAGVVVLILYLVAFLAFTAVFVWRASRGPRARFVLHEDDDDDHKGGNTSILERVMRVLVRKRCKADWAVVEGGKKSNHNEDEKFVDRNGILFADFIGPVCVKEKGASANGPVRMTNQTRVEYHYARTFYIALGLMKCVLKGAYGNSQQGWSQLGFLLLLTAFQWCYLIALPFIDRVT
eukprot:jgi/Chlat1/8341/Chrsp8S08109